MIMSANKSLAVVVAAFLVLIGGVVAYGQTQNSDWRTAVYETGVLATADDPTTCDSTMLGGPAEMKSMTLGFVGSFGNLTVGDVQETYGDDLSNDLPVGAQDLAGAWDSIPEDTKFSEVATIMIDGMFAKCGV